MSAIRWFRYIPNGRIICSGCIEAWGEDCEDAAQFTPTPTPEGDCAYCFRSCGIKPEAVKRRHYFQPNPNWLDRTRRKTE